MNGIFTKKLAGYRMYDYSTIEALKKNKVPVLFIHGGDDNFVPNEMSRISYGACKSRKQLLIVENAEHGSSFLENPELYKKTVIEFLEEK